MPPHRLTRDQARRIAIRAQFLDAARPKGLIETVERLTLLQIDPTAAVAPSADLVLWSRLGSAYRPEDLTAAVEHQRVLYENNALIRPMEDLGLYLAEMAEWPTREELRDWLEANDRFRRDILERLEDAGPLLSRDIADTSQVAWASTGWTNDRNVTQMLEFMAMRGEVAVAGRQGRQRTWDVAWRVYPNGAEVVPLEDALRIRDVRRLRALGIARAKTRTIPMEPYAVGDAGEPAVVEGTEGEWRIDPEEVARVDEPFEGRTALLSPFDRLIHDRTRAEELFDFEFLLEMYKPQDQRRWGYYALPIVHGDRLIGKLDAKADRKAGALVVNAIHQDVPFTGDMNAGVRAEITDLAGWLGLDVSD